MAGYIFDTDSMFIFVLLLLCDVHCLTQKLEVTTEFYC